MRNLGIRQNDLTTKEKTSSVSEFPRDLRYFSLFLVRNERVRRGVKTKEEEGEVKKDQKNETKGETKDGKKKERLPLFSSLLFSSLLFSSLLFSSLLFSIFVL